MKNVEGKKEIRFLADVVARDEVQRETAYGMNGIMKAKLQLRVDSERGCRRKPQKCKDSRILCGRRQTVLCGFEQKCMAILVFRETVLVNSFVFTKIPSINL